MRSIQHSHTSFDDGDVQLFIDVCEDQQWRTIRLCEGEWSLANTRVTCRQLGYGAAGWLYIDLPDFIVKLTNCCCKLQQILQLMFNQEEERCNPTNLIVLEKRRGW